MVAHAKDPRILIPPLNLSICPSDFITYPAVGQV